MADTGAEQLRLATIAPAPIPDDQRPYEPVDALSETSRATIIMAGAGAVLSGVQSSLTRQNMAVMGIFTKTGGAIATYGMCDRARWVIGLSLKLLIQPP